MKVLVVFFLGIVFVGCSQDLKKADESAIAIAIVSRTVSDGPELRSKLDTVYNYMSPDTLVINHFDYGYAITPQKRVKPLVYENKILVDSMRKRIRFKSQDDFRDYFTKRHYRYISFERRENRSNYVFVKD